MTCEIPIHCLLLPCITQKTKLCAVRAQLLLAGCMTQKAKELEGNVGVALGADLAHPAFELSERDTKGKP